MIVTKNELQQPVAPVRNIGRARKFLRSFNRAVVIGATSLMLLSSCASTRSAIVSDPVVRNPSGSPVYLADAGRTGSVVKQPKGLGTIPSDAVKLGEEYQRLEIEKQEALRKAGEAERKAEEAKQRQRAGCTEMEATVKEIKKGCDQGNQEFCAAYAEAARLYTESCGKIARK